MNHLSSNQASSADSGTPPTLGTHTTDWDTPYETMHIYANGFMASDNTTEYYPDGKGGVVTATNYGHVNNTPNADLAFFNAVNDLQTNYSQQLDSAEQVAFQHGVSTIELYDSGMPPMQKVDGVAYIPVHAYSANNYYVNDSDILSALSNS